MPAYISEFLQRRYQNEKKDVIIKETREKILEDFMTFVNDILREQDVKIPVKHPGLLEVPEGKNVEDLPLEHFKDLVKKKGWGEISKGLINLKIWNKDRDPKLSSWANKTQEELATWVEKERESNPKFGD